MRIRKALLLLLSILLLSSVSYAADRSGQEILDDLAFSNVLSGSGVAELNLITENARGQQRKYSVKVYLKSDDAGDRQFLEYLSPADVRGTKFLSLNLEGQEDQMWLYLPAIGRERRIASHMTGDSFMGTDFTYDEIGGNFARSGEYSAERLADEVEGGVTCYVLDLTALSDAALYERIRMWVWQTENVPVKVEFLNSAGVLQKTLTLSDFREVAGELVPHSVVMADNVKGTRTILEILSVSEEEISEDVFTVRYLRR